MRIAREDESRHSSVGELTDLCGHLIGITHDGHTRAAARATDTRPQVSLDVSVGIGGLTNLRLARDTDGLRIQ